MTACGCGLDEDDYRSLFEVDGLWETSIAAAPVWRVEVVCFVKARQLETNSNFLKQSETQEGNSDFTLHVLALGTIEALTYAIPTSKGCETCEPHIDELHLHVNNQSYFTNNEHQCLLMEAPNISSAAICNEAASDIFWIVDPGTSASPIKPVQTQGVHVFAGFAPNRYPRVAASASLSLAVEVDDLKLFIMCNVSVTVRICSIKKSWNLSFILYFHL